MIFAVVTEILDIQTETFHNFAFSSTSKHELKTVKSS